MRSNKRKWDFVVTRPQTGTDALTGQPTMRSLARRSSPCRWTWRKMERAESEAGFIPPSSSRASQYCSSRCTGACRQWGKDKGDRGDANGSLDWEEKRYDVRFLSLSHVSNAVTWSVQEYLCFLEVKMCFLQVPLQMWQWNDLVMILIRVLLLIYSFSFKLSLHVTTCTVPVFTFTLIIPRPHYHPLTINPQTRTCSSCVQTTCDTYAHTASLWTFSRSALWCGQPQSTLTSSALWSFSCKVSINPIMLLIY